MRQAAAAGSAFPLPRIADAAPTPCSIPGFLMLTETNLPAQQINVNTAYAALGRLTRNDRRPGF